MVPMMIWWFHLIRFGYLEKSAVPQTSSQQLYANLFQRPESNQVRNSNGERKRITDGPTLQASNQKAQ